MMPHDFNFTAIAAHGKNPMTMETRSSAVRGLPSPVLARFARLAGSGAIAVLDQALAAASGLIVGVLLARWLGAEDYGAYMVAFSCFMLAQNVYDAALVEPMMVHASGRHQGQLSRYLRHASVIHVWMSLILSLCLAGGAAVLFLLDVPNVAAALAGAACAAPVMLTRWLLRPPLYILSRHQWCLAAGVVQILATLAALGVLTVTGVLSPGSAYGAQAVGTVAAAALLLIPLLRLPDRSDGESLAMSTVLSDHWTYGRWSIPARLLEWASSNIFYLAIPLIASLSVSGTFRATALLLMPALLTMGALGPLLIPAFSRAYASGDRGFLNRRVAGMAAVLGGGAAVYGLGMTVLGIPLISLLYGGKFDGMVTLPMLAAAAVQIVMAALILVVMSALRATGNARLTFVGQIPPTAIMLTAGLLLVESYGVLGAFVANDLSSAAMLVVLCWLYRRAVGSTSMGSSASS
jgi:O-antigen/teichoic acid export membrane protein